MVRLVALISLASGFLAISPRFRQTAWDGLADMVGGLDRYSPFSYIALGAALIFGFFFLLKASAAPR
ncbi:MAG TPA: hypothetical protein VE959_06050 [Bryobacteraceae bacterium]|nr:hypothetical protein [Bryobacteraceae bacterium]